MVSTTRTIVLFAFEGAQTLDVVGPAEVFAGATALLEARGRPKPAYRVRVVANGAGPIRMGSGLQLSADAGWRDLRGPIDTLLVAGGRQGLGPVLGDRALLAWLVRRSRQVRRMGSVCSGAFVLAAAGLLDGRRVTTHWSAADALAADYPSVEVDAEAIWLKDGSIYTSAGVTAGMDLALALVEEDHGREVALTIARHLVLFLKRPGGQSQFSSHLEAQALASGALEELPGFVAEKLAGELTVPVLAERFAMSPRNFARRFLAEFGTTPAKYVERVRLERARQCLEDLAESLDEIASQCGFGTAERMRKTFLRHLRVAPADYRNRFNDQRNDQRIRRSA